MSDPVRLRDDPATPKARQRLLRSEAPDVGYDLERGLSRFRSAVQPGQARHEPARRSLWAPAWSTLRRATASSAWLWLTLPAAATGLWAVERATATRHDVSVNLSHSAAPRSLPAPGAPRALGGQPAPSSAASAPSAVAEPEPVLPATPPSAKRAAPEGRDSQLLAETAHMAELRRLAQTDSGRALAIADQGARQFPRGFFAQEREAIAITSLLRLGRTGEAKARGERFLARHPQGPAAEQIRRAIGQR